MCAINVHALDTRYELWIQNVSTAMTNYCIAYIGIDIVVVIVVWWIVGMDIVLQYNLHSITAQYNPFHHLGLANGNFQQCCRGWVWSHVM